MTVYLAVLSAVALAACGGESANERPARSPAHDYPPPAPRTSDGRVMGADNVDPADRLQEGGTFGSEGVKPAGRPRPGEETDNAPPPGTEDPCHSVGLQDREGRSKCRERAPARKEEAGAEAE